MGLKILQCFRLDSILAGASCNDRIYGWEDPLSAYLTILFSLKQVVSLGHDLTVYTDRPGLNLLGQLPLANLTIRELPINQAKGIEMDILYACGEQNSPFIYLDSNIFISSNTVFSSCEPNELMVQNFIKGSTRKYIATSILESKMSQNVTSSKLHNSRLLFLDRSVLGGNDGDFFSLCYRFISAVARRNRLSADDLSALGDLVINSVAKRKNFFIKPLFNDLNEVHYPFLIADNLITDRYTFISDDLKRDFQTTLSIYRAFRVRYPEFARKAFEIAKKNNLKGPFSSCLVKPYIRTSHLLSYLGFLKGSFKESDISSYVATANMQSQIDYSLLLADVFQYEKQRHDFLKAQVNKQECFSPNDRGASLRELMTSDRDYLFSCQICASDFVEVHQSSWDWALGQDKLLKFGRLKILDNLKLPQADFITIFFYEKNLDFVDEIKITDILDHLIFSCVGDKCNIAFLVNEIVVTLGSPMTSSDFYRQLENRIISRIQKWFDMEILNITFR